MPVAVDYRNDVANVRDAADIDSVTGVDDDGDDVTGYMSFDPHQPTAAELDDDADAATGYMSFDPAGAEDDDALESYSSDEDGSENDETGYMDVPAHVEAGNTCIAG
jgi:hypothetical protein